MSIPREDDAAKIKLQEAFVVNENNILGKKRAAKEYINKFKSSEERSEKICEIIKDGNFVSPLNATAIASLVKDCNIDSEGIKYIASNVFEGFEGSKDIFLKSCELYKVRKADDAVPSANVNLIEAFPLSSHSRSIA